MPTPYSKTICIIKLIASTLTIDNSEISILDTIFFLFLNESLLWDSTPIVIKFEVLNKVIFPMLLWTQSTSYQLWKANTYLTFYAC